MLAVFNLCLRGTPFIYQGQEIGMLNLPMRDPKNSKDCVSWMVGDILKQMHLPGFLRKRILNRLDRDHERSPMQWNHGLSAGFSTSKNTWIEVNENKSYINVDDEENDPTSILNFYKKLIAYHNQSDVLCLGEFKALETKGNVIAWKRILGEKEVTVVLNFGKKQQPLPSFATGKKIALSNYEGGLDNKLRPYAALILEKE